MHKENLIIKCSGLLNLQAQLLAGSIHKATGWTIFCLLFRPYVRIIGDLSSCPHQYYSRKHEYSID